jgi:hypothetical protein
MIQILLDDCCMLWKKLRLVRLLQVLGKLAAFRTEIIMINNQFSEKQIQNGEMPKGSKT